MHILTHTHPYLSQAPQKLHCSLPSFVSRHLRCWGVWCLSRGSPPTNWRASCRTSLISMWWRSSSSVAVPLCPASLHIPTQVSVLINKFYMYMYVSFISWIKHATLIVITVRGIACRNGLYTATVCFVGKSTSKKLGACTHNYVECSMNFATSTLSSFYFLYTRRLFLTLIKTLYLLQFGRWFAPSLLSTSLHRTTRGLWVYK